MGSLFRRLGLGEREVEKLDRSDVVADGKFVVYPPPPPPPPPRPRRSTAGIPLRGGLVLVVVRQTRKTGTGCATALHVRMQGMQGKLLIVFGERVKVGWDRGG